MKANDKELEPGIQDQSGVEAKRIAKDLALRAKADRQWREIPSDPAALTKWMKGDPIND